MRITLLDTCYLAGGFAPGGDPVPLTGVQLRFGDGSAAAWAERVSGFGCDSLGMAAPHARLGAAIHSVRAVAPDQVPEIMAWSHAHGAPVHAHLSEQPLENAECRAAFGRTPAEVLYDAGALGPRTTLVHATHLTERDVELLGGSLSTVCMCPLTEADLADGVGPAPALAAAGLAARARQRRAQRHRPLRGGPLAGAVAAPGDQAARPLQRRRPGDGGDGGRARLPRLARRGGDRAWRVR